MSLFFHECLHVGFSLLAAYIAIKKYNISQKYLVMTIIVAIIGGVLIDLDHLIDYFIAFGPGFNLSQFLQSQQFEYNKKIYVLFHAFEFIPLFLLGLIFFKKKLHKALILAFTIAVLFHLLLDSVSYNLRPGVYFISYRIMHNFDIQYMINSPYE